MPNRVTVPPTSEPVTLAQLREHLGLVEAQATDAELEACISDAREWVENHVELSIGTQTREQVLDAFPEWELELPFGPVQSIESVSYVDTDGDDQTVGISERYLDDVSRPAQLMPAFGLAWPDTREQANAVRVLYVTGYTNGESPDDYPTPRAVYRATLLLAAHWYENREATAQAIEVREIPFGVERILFPLRRPGI